MKKIKYLLLTGICFCSVVSFAQSNSSNQIPINADPSTSPQPVQPVPVPPQQGTPPTNKVMLKAQTDSMDSKRRTTPPSQNVYRDTTRQLIHQGDTETVPRR
jgi:hypothetical protein